MHLNLEMEWIDGALGGVNLAIMGVNPVESINKLRSKRHMLMEDINLIEDNEVFAVQSITVKRELQIPDDKLRVSIGAIALGYPSIEY